MTATLVHDVGEQNFDTEVLAAPLPVLVDFTAPWCGPCRALSPILHNLAAEAEGRLKVVEIDADQHPSLARRFGIRGVPTVIAFVDGKEVARHAGLTSKDKLLKLVERRAPAAESREPASLAR
jgi:thioredoxin 1